MHEVFFLFSLDLEFGVPSVHSNQSKPLENVEMNLNEYFPEFNVCMMESLFFSQKIPSKPGQRVKKEDKSERKTVDRMDMENSKKSIFNWTASFSLNENNEPSENSSSIKSAHCSFTSKFNMSRHCQTNRNAQCAYTMNK